MTGDLFHEGLLAELESAWLPLPDKPDETPELTLQALWACCRPDEERMRGLVARRVAGTPLAHLTGRQTFMGLEMLAGPEALIPRKETEILGRGALKLAESFDSPKILDVCCGSGNVGLALAASANSAEVWLADLSEPAVGLARRNAEHLQLTARTHLVVSDLFAEFGSLRGTFDLIVCNPPYISSAKVGRMQAEIADFEPRMAFDGGTFGVKILTQLIREAPHFLKPGGWLAFEVGAGQGAPVSRMVSANKAYAGMEMLFDSNSEPRVILARTAL